MSEEKIVGRFHLSPEENAHDHDDQEVTDHDRIIDRCASIALAGIDRRFAGWCWVVRGWLRSRHAGCLVLKERLQDEIKTKHPQRKTQVTPALPAQAQAALPPGQYHAKDKNSPSTNEVVNERIHSLRFCDSRS